MRTLLILAVAVCSTGFAATTQYRVVRPYNVDFGIDLYDLVTDEGPTRTHSDRWTIRNYNLDDSGDVSFVHLDSMSGYLLGKPRRNLHGDKLKIVVQRAKYSGETDTLVLNIELTKEKKDVGPVPLP